MSKSLKCVIAQFRTCLWPCVGRWASGQEAGQPPKEEPASLHPRPAAGGETGAPRSPRGTRLKATTERAFLVTTESCRSPKRLVLLCRACGSDLPFRTKAAIGWDRRRREGFSAGSSPRLIGRRVPPLH